MRDTLIQFLVLFQLAAGFGIAAASIYFQWKGNVESVDDCDGMLMLFVLGVILTLVLLG